MKNQSLVDLFDLYDLTFDEICQELNVTDIPTWQQRWFYRYYQVNLLPQITFLLYNNTDAIELQNMFKKYKDQYECESIYETNQKFYSTFVDSFPNWWFKRARNYFVNKKDKVSPIIGIRFDDELKPAYLSSAMNFFQNEVKSIFKKSIDQLISYYQFQLEIQKKKHVNYLKTTLMEQYFFQTIKDIMENILKAIHITRPRIKFR